MSSLSGIQKAVILLRSLPPDAMERVLAQAGPERANRLRAELKQATDGPALSDGLREIAQEVEALLARAAGPPAVLVSNAVQAPAGAQVNVVADDARPQTPDEPPADPIEALRVLSTDLLTRALEAEQPRTVSLVLNLLDPGPAGEIYRKLPAGLRREASLCLASQPMPGRDLLARICQAILTRAQALSNGPPASDGEARLRKMVDLFRQVDRAERAELLAALEAKDPASAQALKDQLFQFEDLLRVENISIQKLLGELDTKTLALALKGAPTEIEARILSNLSKRAQETLREEMDLIGAASPAKSRPARKAIVEAMRALDEKGELSLIE
jgi:flagellar motor switch protein FliG